MGSNRFFPGGWGGKGVSPGPAENLLIPPPPQKIPPSVDSAHSPNFYSPPTLTPHPRPPPKIKSPTKQQFPIYNPIKTAFLAVVIALAPFLF